MLAKKFGIKSPEDFAITLTRHFLSKYRHVKEAHVHVEEYPWERIRYNNADNMSKQHNHAFLFTPVANRYCDVIQQRGKYITVHSRCITHMCDDFSLEIRDKRNWWRFCL